MQEKRRFERIQFERQVQLDFSSELYTGCQLKNLSYRGVYVIGEYPHKAGEQCIVTLSQTSRTTSLRLKSLSQIVHRDKGGIGLEFLSMSFESLLSLEMILLYQGKEKSEDAERSVPSELPFQVCEDISWIPDE